MCLWGVLDSDVIAYPRFADPNQSILSDHSDWNGYPKADPSLWSIIQRAMQSQCWSVTQIIRSIPNSKLIQSPPYKHPAFVRRLIVLNAKFGTINCISSSLFDRSRVLFVIQFVDSWHCILICSIHAQDEQRRQDILESFHSLSLF